MAEEKFEEAINSGRIEITGRLVDASNATLFGTIDFEDQRIQIVYKPVAGERPLWDFDTGNLASREVAAYLLSQAGGFHLVPTTVLREGPFGLGAVQRWIDVNPELDLITWAQSQDSRLRKMALFDAIINNTDRKFGHILLDDKGNLYGCDHGVTFHSEAKLRTVIWQFADQELTSEEVDQLDLLAKRLNTLELDLRDLLSEVELYALNGRISDLRENRRFPLPNPEWPAVPWPPV